VKPIQSDAEYSATLATLRLLTEQDAPREQIDALIDARDYYEAVRWPDDGRL
jgi:hypothetical protein